MSDPEGSQGRHLAAQAAAADVYASQHPRSDTVTATKKGEKNRPPPKIAPTKVKKAQTTRPAAISTPSAIVKTAPTTGALPATPAATNPLTILAIGAGVFLVIVLATKKRR